jgi:hypothetical protein
MGYGALLPIANQVLSTNNSQVLAAFVLSAVMTVVAVIAAYLTDSMPIQCITDTDQAYIDAFQRIWSRFTATSPVLFVGLCWIVVSKLVFRRGPTKVRVKRTREQRQASFTQFILTLSDQQLVVGLAILVAAVSNQCTLFMEEFKIAFSLAWFSNTTHLATLDNLRHHFHEHPSARNRRVAGMLALLAFFIYCFSILYLATPYGDSRPVQCYIEERGSFPLDPSYYTNIVNVVWIITLLFVVNSYRDRILKSYTLPANGSFGISLVSAKLKLFLFKTIFPQDQLYQELYKASFAEWRFIWNEYNREQWSLEQRKLLNGFNSTHSPHQWNPALTETIRQSIPKAIWKLRSKPGIPRKHSFPLVYDIFLPFAISNHVYRRSFLSQTPSLTFMLTYGLAQLVYYRWLETVFTESRSMGFGQITPIFLLILPVVAAMEIFTGMLLPEPIVIC